MIYHLQENRVFRTYLGGRHLDAFLGKETGVDSNFPEDWTASTVKAFNPGREEITEGYGRVTDGREVRSLPDASLRCLVKLLDSAERLVIQVHPTRDFAREYFHSEHGKTECWYMLDCDEDACVYVGFREGITPSLWRDVFDRQDIDAMLSLLHRIPVKKGDCVFVDGGLPHAIGKGCFMIEVQEPTDLMGVTERKTPSGRPLAESKLHGGIGIDNMMKMFHYRGAEAAEIIQKHFLKPREIGKNVSRLVGETETPLFSLMRIDGTATVMPDRACGVVIVTDGAGEINGVCVKAGDRLLYTSESRLECVADGAFSAILCC